jgi:hypothetical protein
LVVQVLAPGDEVTEYPVMAAPPFDAGAVQDTFDETLLAEEASTVVGAPGTVDGIAPAEAAETTEVPLGFVAVTVNV